MVLLTVPSGTDFKPILQMSFIFYKLGLQVLQKKQKSIFNLNIFKVHAYTFHHALFLFLYHPNSIYLS